MTVRRYPRTSGRLPKRSKTLPVYGTGDDAGRYYRCWHCGWICDSKREALGNGNSGSGLSHEAYAAQTGSAYNAGINPQPVATLDSKLWAFYALRTTPTTSVRYLFKSNVQAGCPFCGSLNWRGDY